MMAMSRSGNVVLTGKSGRGEAQLSLWDLLRTEGQAEQKMFRSRMPSTSFEENGANVATVARPR